MSLETTRKLVDVLIAFIVGSGLLYGAEWALPRVTENAKVKAKEVLDSPAVRRARAATAMAALKGSWSLKGAPQKKLQQIATRVSP